MLKGVDVVCFASCYALALLIELARLFLFKDAKFLPKLSLAFMTLGGFAHAAFLYHNDLLQNEHFFASAGGWFSVLAFAVMLTAIYLSLVSPRTPFCLFLAPLTLALTGVAILAGNAVFTPAATCRCVRATHATSLLLATLLAFLGTASGGMYFWQRTRLKRHVAESSIALPTLEWLSRTCRLAANVTVVALGLGVASGFYLKFFSGASARHDLASVCTPILFIVALLARFPKRRAQAVDMCAINAIYNFVVLAAMTLILFFAAFGPSGHWKPLTPQEINVDAIAEPAPELSAPLPEFQPEAPQTEE